MFRKVADIFQEPSYLRLARVWDVGEMLLINQKILSNFLCTVVVEVLVKDVFCDGLPLFFVKSGRGQ